VHKSDVGGVRVDLYNEDMVREAYRAMLATVAARAPSAHVDGVSVQTQFKGRLEMIVGARRDAAFGPVVVFGAGGVMVDLLPVRAIARAPVAAEQVIALLKRMPIWPLFEGFRGERFDLAGVVDAIVRVGWLAADLARVGVFEIDLNPLLVSCGGCCVVDARLFVS
jgi:hypothetical protein